MNEMNIPGELRELSQWVCWKYEKSSTGKSTKVPYDPRTMRPASVVDPSTWVDFNTAVAASRVPQLDGIGFVLTDGDPYAIIDLDNKPDSPPSEEDWKTHQNLLSHCHTYIERSPSGRGYHIVMRGRVAQGLKRGSVEIYSSKRYMAFTGDAVKIAPITDCQEILDYLMPLMQPAAPAVPLEQSEAVVSDFDLIEGATYAANGPKYVALCTIGYRKDEQGRWQFDQNRVLGDCSALGYPSQSEADYALLAMLCFYTRSNEQVKRLFRASGLGKRDKASASDVYLDRTIGSLRRKQPTNAEMQASIESAQEIIQKAKLGKEEVAPSVTTVPTPPQKWPPGLIGHLAQYFFESAIRPVHEIAVAAAIALCAGIAGRQFNISRTGLNQYILVIAKTGTGKEGAATAIEALIAQVRPKMPTLSDDFIGPGAFASGQGLIKALDAKPGFLSILGEFGLTLQSMNDPRANQAHLLFKRVLLDLYGKSGWSNVLRSTAYSDTEKNTKTIPAPALTLLGESTPSTFYDGISQADVSDGLLPRFHIMEYSGNRPPLNPNANMPAPDTLVDEFLNFAATVIAMKNNHSHYVVPLSDGAAILLGEFEREATGKINDTSGEASREIWNRAHLKALRFAALLAVGVQPNNPVVSVEDAQWAIEEVKKGARILLTKFAEGDIGKGDGKQMALVKQLIREYFKLPAKKRHSYKIDTELWKAGIVQYGYLVMRCTRLSAFTKDIRGVARSLESTLDVLENSGMLSKLDKVFSIQKFKTKQKLYMLEGDWTAVEEIDD